jgi:hypothetical protein
MIDADLLRFGKDHRYMRSPHANTGKPPLEAFVTQLREARALRSNYVTGGSTIR